MNAWAEIATFAAKLLLVLLFITAVAAVLVRASLRGKSDSETPLQVKALHEQMEQRRSRMELALAPPAARKQVAKTQAKRRKARDAAAHNERPRVFVLDFTGDIRASAVASLRDEVTAILQVAGTADEVVVRLESPGGMVHSYGLAASQLARIRDRGIRLTAVVDKVAASGGYMMACVADRIVAAPFSIIGSIGVVMQLPNFHRLLKRKDIDFELLTAGEHKRTLTLFGENTEPARSKAREDLEDTHRLFKEFITQYRPGLDIDKVATGEHWFASRARAIGLVDELMTSDDYLLQRLDTHDVYGISLQRPKPFLQRLTERFADTDGALGAAGLAHLIPRSISR